MPVNLNNALKDIGYLLHLNFSQPLQLDFFIIYQLYKYNVSWHAYQVPAQFQNTLNRTKRPFI